MARRKAVKQMTLAERLDTSEAPALLRSLQDLRGNDLTVDGSQVDWIGALSAQVLVSARMTWDRDSRRFTIKDPSAGLEGGLLVLGLRSELLESRSQP